MDLKIQNCTFSLTLQLEYTQELKALILSFEKLRFGILKVKMVNILGKLPIYKKTGNEPFLYKNEQLDNTLKDFRGWGFSNLATNNLRGILAEYIVACAIGSTDSPREERDAYDLITKEGLKIEVKSASYLQSREQKKLSTISFSIRPTLGWDNSQKRSDTCVRQSDVYVFCLLAHNDQPTLNPLDLSQWEFYIVSTQMLNAQVRDQKTISLGKLEKLGIEKVGFKLLRDSILKIK